MRRLTLALALLVTLAGLGGATPAHAGRLFGHTERTIEVKNGRTDHTTRRFDRHGRLRRSVVDQRTIATGLRRVTTELRRADGMVSIRAIDTTVARAAGGSDRDLWLQAFGKDDHVALDLTIGQVGGKLSAYLLAGRSSRRFGTASEIHWDREAKKLRYVPGK